MSQKYKAASYKLCRCCHKWRCRCLIPRQAKPHPPFNSGTKMDNKLGLHPKMSAFALEPAVGSYYPRPIGRKPEAISWEKKEETERFSATVGGKLAKEIMAQKNLMKTGGGPGTYDILRWPESTVDAPCKSLQENVAFGTVPRLIPRYKSTTPGPGYTLRVHNPYYYLEQKRLKGFSQVAPFEFDGLAPRFREIRRSWSLACNRYNVKHPHSLDVFLKKVTGKRGPYDLFTGPRDETTLRGAAWTREKLPDSGDWPRKLPGEVDKLLSKANYFKGKWTTNPRFPKKPVMRILLQNISTCYKDPDEPGPGHYDPQAPQKPTTRKKYPFDSNVEFARPLPPSDIRPGPTRYRSKQVRITNGHGWTSVFNSKVPRTIVFLSPPSHKLF